MQRRILSEYVQEWTQRVGHLCADRLEGGVVEADRVGDIVHPLATRLLSSGLR